MLRFLRIPTFSVMIMQGIFGGMPWTIMGALVGNEFHNGCCFFNSLEIWKMKQFPFFGGGVGGQKLDLLFFRF